MYSSMVLDLGWASNLAWTYYFLEVTLLLERQCSSAGFEALLNSGWVSKIFYLTKLIISGRVSTFRGLFQLNLIFSEITHFILQSTKRFWNRGICVSSVLGLGTIIHFENKIIALNCFSKINIVIELTASIRCMILNRQRLILTHICTKVEILLQ